MAGTRRRAIVRARGDSAERLAERHLVSNGLTLLSRNYRCRFGEVDLVMADRQTIAFVEVRLRAKGRFGGALQSVDERKQGRLIQAASAYLGEHPEHEDAPVRFDVVALDGQPGGKIGIKWLRDAFRP